MKDEKIRIAVAVRCGWNPKPSPCPPNAGMGFSANKPEWCFPYQLPKYESSLDAMAAAEATLTEQECTLYEDAMGNWYNGNLSTSLTPASRRWFGCSAAQRAQAFIAVKKLTL